VLSPLADSTGGEAGQFVWRSWSFLLANSGQLPGNSHDALAGSYGVVAVDLGTENGAFPAIDSIAALREGISASESKLRRWQQARASV